MAEPAASPRARPGALLSSFLVALLVAAAAAAQNPLTGVDPGSAAPEGSGAGQAFEDSVEVRLVELDVQVLDRKGHPVTGLDKDDFELRIDGEPVPVEFFGGSGAGAAPEQLAEAEPAASGSTLDRGTYVVMYVDVSLLEPGDLEAVKPHVSSFLRETLSPEAQVMLVAADKELSIEVPFTSDRSLVAKRLEAIDGRRESGQLVQMYDQALRSLQRHKRDTAAQLRFRDPLDLERRQRSAGTGGTASYGRQGGGRDQGDGGGQPSDSLLPPPGPALDIKRHIQSDPQIQLQEADNFHRQANKHLLRVARDLQSLVRTLSGLEGRRHLVYLGNRLPTGAARHLFQVWKGEIANQVSDGNIIAARSLDERSSALDAAFEAQSNNERYGGAGPWFAEVGLLASGLGVTIHAVEVPTRGRSRGFLEGAVDVRRGEIDPHELVDSASAMGELDGLGTLAAVTGGRTFRRSSKFANFFSTLASDLNRRYTLGFSLPASTEHRAVEVRLRSAPSRGAEVYHPASLLVRNVDQEVADLTLSALTLEPLGENPLDLELEAGSPEPSGDAFAVPLSVKLPLSRLALLPDRQSHAGRLSVYTVAGGLTRGPTPVVKSVVPVRIRNTELLTALGRKVEYKLEVAVPTSDPGRVAVTVRDEYRPAVATRVTVVVPDAAPGLGAPGSGAGEAPDASGGEPTRDGASGR